MFQNPRKTQEIEIQGTMRAASWPDNTIKSKTERRNNRDRTWMTTTKDREANIGKTRKCVYILDMF